MPTQLERLVQLGCSSRKREQRCRRAVCRRYGYCLPPRDRDHAYFYRCPFDTDDAWLSRAAAVGKMAQWLKKVAEAGYAARGVRSPFAPKPVPDHLDPTQPFDFPALLAQQPEAE